MADQGDPTGRRLAGHRARLLAEAGHVAHALNALLKRASFGTLAIEALAKAIGREELRQLQRAEGKIESRRRFGKHSSQPLLERRPVHNLFLDESGNPPSNVWLDQRSLL